MVRKLGFRAVEVTLHARPDGARVDTVTLVPLVPTLNEVVIKGVPYNRRLWDEGFYRRQRGARGTFFDEAEVRFLTSGGLAPLLRAVPRVEVVQQGSQEVALGSAGGRSCRMHIYIDRAYQWQAMPAARMGMNSAMGLRGLIDPAAVFAVEVYPTPVSVPAEFTRMATGGSTSGSQIPSLNTAMKGPPPADDPNAPCGALVIWTKAWAQRRTGTPE